MKSYFKKISFIIFGFLLVANSGALKTNKNSLSVRATGDLTETHFLNVNSNHHNLFVEGKNGYEFMLHYDTAFSSTGDKSKINIATSEYEVGNKVTYNGVPLKDLDNFYACYFAGSTGCMLQFIVPSSMMSPSNGYAYQTVFVPKGTVIYDTVTGEDVTVHLIDGKWLASFGDDVIYTTQNVAGISAYGMTNGYSLESPSLVGYDSNKLIFKINECTDALGATLDFRTENYDLASINSITFKVKFDFTDPSISESEFRITVDGGTDWVLRYNIGSAISNTWYTITLNKDKTVTSDIPSGSNIGYKGFSGFGEEFGQFNVGLRIKPSGAKIALNIADVIVDGVKSETSSFIKVNQFNNNKHLESEHSYSTMLEFTNNFAITSKETVNIANADNDLGKKMTINGVAIKDITGFFAAYYYASDVNTPMIWFTIPEDNINPSNGYEFTTLFIPAGTQVYNLKIKDDITLALVNGEWSLIASFTRVNQYNNNKYLTNEQVYSTMLEFDTKLFSESQTGTNLATGSYDLGNKMTLNGVVVKNIPGFFAAYYYALDVKTPMLWFQVPKNYINPIEGYNHTRLFLPAGTKIFDVVTRNNIELYLINGAWLGLGDKWSDVPEEIDEYDYSFAIVGDPQDINLNAPENFHKIYDWIVDNKDYKKIAYTIGLGDITNNDTDAEWGRARDSFEQMEQAGMRHTQVRGNHDSLNKFENFFKDDLYYKEDIAGYYEDGKVANCYRVFKVGSIDYLVLALDYGPSNGALEWANEVVSSHPYHNVIVVTHGYLFRDGTTLDKNDPLTPSVSNSDDINDGEEIWQKFVKKHANITIVISGHTYCDNVLVSEAIGDNGNTITQVLIDPQQMDREGLRTGLVAMFYFSNDGKNIQIEYYSTILELYEITSEKKKITVNVIPAEEHVYHEHAAITATCNSDGNLKYWTCDNEYCDKVFIEDSERTKIECSMDEIIVPKLSSHVVNESTVEFKFKEDNTVEVTYICDSCGEKVTVPSEEVVVTSEKIKDATCSEKGLIRYTATWGEIIRTNDAEIPLANHSSESIEKVVGQEATCLVPGFKDAWYCSTCGNYYSDQNLSILIGNEDAYNLWKVNGGALTVPHSLTKINKVDSTCCSCGCKEYYYCKNCNKYFENAQCNNEILNLDEWKNDGGKIAIDPNNHTHLIEHGGSEPTCSENGSKAYFTCEGCQKTLIRNSEGYIQINPEDVVIEALGHLYNKVDKVEPTPTSDGYKEHYKCSECNSLFVLENDEYVPVSLQDLKISYIAPTPVKEEENVAKQKSKGCSGSIIASTNLITLISLAGISLLVLRKKRS